MIFKYESPWGDEVEEIQLFEMRYSNGNLAVVAKTLAFEPFMTITVCLPYEELSSRNKLLAFIDTNNNPGIDKWLEKNKIAIPTGKLGKSGYCIYPEYKFNLDALEE